MFAANVGIIEDVIRTLGEELWLGKVYVSLIGAVLGGLAGVMQMVGQHSAVSTASIAATLVAFFLSGTGLVGGFISRWYRRPGAGTMIVCGILGVLVISPLFIPAAIVFILTGAVLYVKHAPAEETAPV